jgi:hypothetical protein
MLRNTSEYGKTTQWGRKRRGRRKMCLDVLGMHGEMEEVWSGSAACWFDRSLVPGDVNPLAMAWAHARPMAERL